MTSTGLVPFMERYSNSTREVAQDGRRGALMLSVSIKHPDSEAFIDAKMTEGKVTGANVSVKLTDAFMQAAIDGKPYVQQYPIDATDPVFKKEINATDLWKKNCAQRMEVRRTRCAFLGYHSKESVPDCYADLGYRTVSTNLAVRYLYAPTTLAACWLSTYIPMYQSVQAGRLLRFRPLQEARCIGPAHHGRYHRSGVGKDRTHHGQD